MTTRAPVVADRLASDDGERRKNPIDRVRRHGERRAPSSD